jgi:hypothetical protein
VQTFRLQNSPLFHGHTIAASLLYLCAGQQLRTNLNRQGRAK